MKRNKKLTVGLVAVLVAALSMGMGTSAAAPALPVEQPALAEPGRQADVKYKDEVVYGTLTAQGTVESLYTVNHFELTGIGEVTDHGAYAEVVNLTDTQALRHSGESVAFVADSPNFYYQGNMLDTALPWVFELAYTLDGAAVEPEALAGATGELGLHIGTQQGAAADPVFYDNYMLQITVTLDTDQCENIDAPDGTAATAGSSRVIAYTVLPGKDADFTLTADVRDFTMPGVDITAMPYSMNVDFPDMDDSLGDLEKLPEAIEELNEGVGELLDGTREMKDGAGELQSGSASIGDGLRRLGGNAGQLVGASSQINGALAQISGALNDGSLDNIDLSEMEQLPAALTALADGLTALSGGLMELKEGYAPAYAALAGAIEAIPDGGISQEQIQALYMQVDPAQHDVLNALAGQYAAAQTVKGTYAQVAPAFGAVGPALDAATAGIGEVTTGLNTMAEEMGKAIGQLGGLSRLSELAHGVAALSDNYAAFHGGLVEYTGGVQTLASGYGTFQSGVSTFRDGVSELSEGVGELHDGTTTLNDEIADMPDMIQDEIDSMKEEYMPADFDPVSFTSTENTDTDFVQFVLKCAPIELPEQDDAVTEEEADETFWDRLRALFV